MPSRAHPGWYPLPRTCRLVVAAATLLMATAPQAVLNAAEGPFSGLTGRWSGGGQIKKSNGGSERIKCNATYTPGAANLALRLNCASDSYKFDLSSTVNASGSSFSGTWSEASRGVTGGIQGTTADSGRSIRATASAAAFSADLTVTTRGTHQSVRILSPGTEVPEVDIALDRR
jgi:hypothetical protein